MNNNSQRDNKVLEYYLHDLGILLKERALEAREEQHLQMDEVNRAYHTGYLMAMHNVISLMQQQADSFGIPTALMRLEDINPDRDLL